MAKHTLAKTHNCKGSKKIVNNGESLNQTHYFCYEKKKTTNIQCYIYMGQKT
jgi:hypothetical protein